MTNMNSSDVSRYIPITIDKPESNKYNQICFDMTNILDAMLILSPTAFLLYVFFSLYNDRSVYDFTDEDFQEATGLPSDTYAEAYNELIFNNYLTVKERGADVLYFHDAPLNPPFLPRTVVNCKNEWNDTEEW